MGYGPMRQLLTVELPLAVPAAMAGLRIATVSAVALTTVGAIVGYGGLGNLIYAGMNTVLQGAGAHRVRAVRGHRGRLRSAAARRGTAAHSLAPGRPADAGAKPGHGGSEAAGHSPRAADMNTLSAVWTWLTTAAHWSGDDGIWHRLEQHLLLTFSAW